MTSGHSGASSMLSLSRNLRNHIYRRLLVPGRGCPEPKKNIHLGILRVNKQIHNEAREIFYEENLWAVFAIKYQFHPSSRQTWENKWLFRMIPSEDGHSTLLFGGPATVRVDVRSADGTSSQVDRFYITPLFAAESLFRAFISNSTKENRMDELDFTILLANRAFQKAKCQGELLEYLADLRGVRKARVLGMEPDLINQQTAEMMMTPIKHVDEIYTRGCKYHERADQARIQRRYSEAKITYDLGFNYLYNATDRFKMRNHNINPLSLRKLEDKGEQLRIGYGITQLEAGDFEKAAAKLNSILANWDENNLSAHTKAQGWYHHGLALKATIMFRSAEFAFLKAIELCPGSTKAEEKLATIEELVDQFPGGLGGEIMPYYRSIPKDIWRMDYHIRIGIEKDE